jgi:hypothetical protein
MALPAVQAGTLTVSDLRGSPGRRRKEGAVRYARRRDPDHHRHRHGGRHPWASVRPSTSVRVREPPGPRVLKPTLEILAGIPSWSSASSPSRSSRPEIIQRLWDHRPQFTLMAPASASGILVIPLVASISEDAMRSVPDMSLREASYGMGARKRHHDA